MTKTVNKISTEAVQRATGRSWDQWIRFIDRGGGEALDHKAIVKLLGNAGKIESGWWQQTVAVGYEHAKGKRRTGETADAGFQVGVQGVIAMERGAPWELRASRRSAPCCWRWESASAAASWPSTPTAG